MHSFVLYSRLCAGLKRSGIQRVKILCVCLVSLWLMIVCVPLPLEARSLPVGAGRVPLETPLLECLPRKHHYNHCPIKRGKDKKKINGYYYGVASFYHARFNGRKTWNGDRFNPKKMTCAHRSLPMGTYVEVINLSNHRCVTVRINDRLPPRSCRMVDLTHTAAAQLHMLRQGLAKVKMRVVDKPEPSPISDTGEKAKSRP